VEILALDVGAKRVGMARASTVARFAEPLKTVSTDDALEELRALVKLSEVEAIVVGLPRNLSGEDTDQTRWVREWVTKLKTHINTPMYWQDEALTSREAAGKLQTSNSKVQNFDVDAHAAAIILDDFLKSDKRDWVLV
jgi:putative Holliday junction resolvase